MHSVNEAMKKRLTDPNRTGQASSTSPGSRRADISLYDMQVLANDRARVAFRYRSEPAPSSLEIDSYITATWQGRLHGVNETYKIAKIEDPGAIGGNYVLAEVEVRSTTRPFAESERLSKINPTLFSDRADGSLWEVTQRGDNKFLARKDNIEIEGELRAEFARQASNRGRGSPLKILDHVVEALTSLVEDKDLVAYYHGGQRHEGTVIAANEQTHVWIKPTDQLTPLRLARKDVHSIIRKAEETEQQRSQNLFEYYARVYGPEFAKQLVFGEPPAITESPKLAGLEDDDLPPLDPRVLRALEEVRRLDFREHDTVCKQALQLIDKTITDPPNPARKYLPAHTKDFVTTQKLLETVVKKLQQALP